MGFEFYFKKNEIFTKSNSLKIINAKIIVFSPQPWNHIKISKHHYAEELAKHNQVWFVTAPQGFGISFKENLINDRLVVVSYKTPVPYLLKFRLPRLYSFVNSLFLKLYCFFKIGKVQIVFDFGSYTFLDHLYGIFAEKKVFFPVDDNKNLSYSKRGADYLFSVSSMVVEKLKSRGIHCILLNHGLSDKFVLNAGKRMCQQYIPNTPFLKVGYSGNLMIPFLDRPLLCQLIEAHPSIEFHLFGHIEQWNIDDNNAVWLSFLHSCPNIFLHGSLSTEQLIEDYEHMDAFILTYQPDDVNYHADNSHKILEYLSFGKVLISTWISYYENKALFPMTPKLQNDQFHSIFENVIANLKKWNTADLYQKRISFALEHTYMKNIESIGSILYEF